MKQPRPDVYPVEAERALLACLCENNRWLAECGPLAHHPEWCSSQTKDAASVIFDMIHAGQHVSETSIADELRRRLPDAPFSYADIRAMVYTNDVVSGLSARTYAEQIIRAASERHAYRWGEKIALAALSDGATLQALVDARAADLAQFQGGPAQAIIAQDAVELLHKDIPPPKWAVPDLFAEGLTILAGKPKKGKSSLALGVLLAVAHGGVALGKIPVEQGEALYLALEDNERRMQRRLQYMTDDGDAEPPEQRLHLMYDWPRIDEGGIDAFDLWMDAHPATRIIVVDTYKRIKPRQVNKNLTLYESDYENLLPLQQWATRRGVAVVVIAHTRKASAEDANDEISGSTGLTGVADNLVVMRKGSDFTELHRSGRDYVDVTIWALKGDEESLRWTIQGPLMEARRSQERQDIVDAIKIVGRGLTPLEIANLVHRTSVNVRHMLHKMRDSGDTSVVFNPSTKLYELPSLSKREVTGVMGVTRVTGVTGVTHDHESVTPERGGVTGGVTPANSGNFRNGYDDTPVTHEIARTRTREGDVEEEDGYASMKRPANWGNFRKGKADGITECPRREPGNPHHYVRDRKPPYASHCQFCGELEPPRDGRLSIVPPPNAG
jgi:hypothetical protein